MLNIIIPMAGRSSRFTSAGYNLPKWRLPLGDSYVFERAVGSFERVINHSHFTFVVQAGQNAGAFIETCCARLGVTSFQIIEIRELTRGQAESVAIALEQGDASEHDPLVVFNVDTFRPNWSLPDHDNCAGTLEVFEGDGDGWSFVEPGPNGSVVRTTEKDRVSNLCSTGLYTFRDKSVFRLAYDEFADHPARWQAGELYVAPLYNVLVARGMPVRYTLIDRSAVTFCGTPDEYEQQLGMDPISDPGA